MRLRPFLILILLPFLLVLFQNFSAPARVLPTGSGQFESNETNPQRRLGDFAKYQMGPEAVEKLKRLESKLQFEIRAGKGREPASIDSSYNSDFASEGSEGSPSSKKVNPFKYSLANIRTFRIRDDFNRLNCRVDSDGVNLSFERQISTNSSYSIEHNTRENKSQAKIQWNW